MASSLPPRPHLASASLFGLYGLIPTSTASFGSNGQVWPLRPRLALTASPQPLQLYLSLHGHVWPQRPSSQPSSASTALSQPPWPRFGLHGLIWPPRPRLALTASSRPLRPYPGLHGLVWPPSIPGFHSPVRPPRPRLASAALVCPNGLISASSALSRPPWPRLGLHGPIWPLRPYPDL
jgi:hypothetical protein